MPRNVFVIVCLSLLLGTGCQLSQNDNQKLSVLLAGLSFNLPIQPKIIAMPNIRGDFLIFKYGDQPGQNYLAFSLEAAIDESCSSEEFFQAVVNPTPNTLCNSHAIAVFTRQFADQYPAEHWPRAQHSAYYFQTNNQRQFIFIPMAANKLLKIDSDFFSKQQLLDLVDNND